METPKFISTHEELDFLLFLIETKYSKIMILYDSTLIFKCTHAYTFKFCQIHSSQVKIATFSSKVLSSPSSILMLQELKYNGISIPQETTL